MTCEFNVDRFYAQLGAFSIFVISQKRGVNKSKKRQGMCHLDDTALSSSSCELFKSFSLFQHRFSVPNMDSNFVLFCFVLFCFK